MLSRCRNSACGTLERHYTYKSFSRIATAELKLSNSWTKRVLMCHTRHFKCWCQTRNVSSESCSLIPKTSFFKTEMSVDLTFS